MNFRKLVAIIGAAMIVAAIVIIVAILTATTQTAYGRDQLRNLIVTRIAPSVQGTMYLGKMTGGLLTGVTIDSIEIRDHEDSLFIASGKITMRYDPRNLLDGRLLFSRVVIERPVIRVMQHENGEWNYRRIFPKKKKGALPDAPSRFGNFFIIDSVAVHDATYILTMPWHPADSLSGARRDSAVRYNLKHREREIRQTREGFTRTYRWTGGEVALAHARLAHPDSVGRYFDIGRINVRESDPPFQFRNVRGTMRWIKDSVWLDLAHFDLPGSTGSARAKVVWGSNLPMRYAVDAIADSVSLNDVSWVYPTLPRDGGGRLKLSIRNNRQNLKILEYAISDMDIRTQGSHLKGAMTFGVGGPVLVVKNVALEASPVDMRLIRTLNGKPFPYDWQGQLRGVIRARGGPLNRWKVDDARLVFNDANVPGAVSRFSGKGELDVLFPAFTVFRGFSADVAQLDLRTLQFVNREFPRVNGFLSGRATLDSSWLDVRFRDADVTHRDGPDAPSHFTGGGRMTLGDDFIAYDLDLAASPLSFTTLARSYPAMPLRGSHVGRMRVNGTLNNLAVTTSLTGPGGTFGVDGTFDLFPSRYGARGTISLASVDLRTLLARDDLPHTDLTGRITSALSGDSLTTMQGTLAVDIDRSLIDRLRILDSRARLALVDGRLRVDTLALHTTAATLAGVGAIGLSSRANDSLRLVINMDSLGGLRRYLRARKRPNAEGLLPRATVAEKDLDEAVRDSLAGAARIDIMLRGSLDMLAASGTVDGRAFFLYGDRVERIGGSFQLSDVLNIPDGRMALRFDTVSIAGIRLDSLSASVVMLDPEHMRFSLATLSGNGPTATAAGSIVRSSDTTALSLDTVMLRVGRSRWTLPSPARVRATPTGVELVNFRLRNGSGGWLELGGTLPLKHEVDFSVRADSVPLADLGALAQMPTPLGGLGKLDWRITGHREDPQMRLAAEWRNVRYSGVNLERVEMRGSYAGKRLADTLILYRGGKPVLTADASFPIDLALMAVDDRLLGDSLRGSIRADSVELAVLEAFTPLLQNSSGTLVTNVRLGGTVRRPRATGSVVVINGSARLLSAGLNLQRVNANIELTGDAARIERFTMQSGAERGDTASLRGFVSFRQLDNPEFGLAFTARRFRIIGRRSIADLQVTTPGRSPISLEGEFKRARLTGTLLIERGTIFIPELAEKRLTDLRDPELSQMLDTSRIGARALLPDAPSELVANMSIQGVKIRIGDDVWIRSSEANIKLSGEVDVTRTQDPADPTQSRLALFGILSADRGTYRLNLGIVQRTFDLEEGTVRFFGDADINPTMDINALHVVRQANKQDIRIRVHLGGTLLPPPGPELSFSSADGYRIDQPQLLSYLITGAPTFETAETDESVTEKAVSVALRSAGGYLSSRLSGALGLDVVQVQTGGGPASGLLRSRQAGAVGLDYLKNTRIGVGKQLNERLFISANTGLCKFDASRLSTSSEYLESIGVKVDYRLPSNVIVSGGTEPEASSLICADARGLRGFISTPRQWGFDLSKTWKF